jgi:drug/metabolite transporter (DMT)-like permease
MVAASIGWAFYSWQLMHTREPVAIRSDWAAFLLAQVVFGAAWSGLFAAAEWAVTDWRIDWGWTLGLALVYVAIGPAIIALRCWDVGVRRVGPSTAGFFSNLTPLFAALLSLAILGDAPKLYHAVAFVLIVVGIVLSARRRAA